MSIMGIIWFIYWFLVIWFFVKLVIFLQFCFFYLVWVKDFVFYCFWYWLRSQRVCFNDSGGFELLSWLFCFCRVGIWVCFRFWDVSLFGTWFFQMIGFFFLGFKVVEFFSFNSLEIFQGQVGFIWLFVCFLRSYGQCQQFRLVGGLEVSVGCICFFLRFFQSCLYLFRYLGNVCFF